MCKTEKGGSVVRESRQFVVGGTQSLMDKRHYRESREKGKGWLEKLRFFQKICGKGKKGLATIRLSICGNKQDVVRKDGEKKKINHVV